MKKNYLKLRPTTLLAASILAFVSNTYAQADDPKAELKALAQAMEPFSMRVLGPPVGTSEWLFVVKPFWSETVKDLSDGKVKVALNSVTEINVAPSDALQLTSQGTFDLTNMIANYGSGDVPELDGFDLAGVAGKPDTIRKVLKSYEPVAAKAIQKRFKVDLLGAGMSGAQTFFCRGDVKDVHDLKGKKVRVSSSTLADFVKGLGAVPVTMAFGELVPALQRGVIDCVITGTMSGNTAKLYEVSDTMYTMIAGWAPTIQVANLRFMSKLDDKQRAWLKKATDYYYRNVSDTIQLKNVNEGIWCTTGDSRCTMLGEAGVTQGKMKHADPSAADLAAARDVVEKNVLPAFGAACGKECTSQWNASIGKAVNLQISQ